MKIRYEPFPGFNNRHDFLFSNGAVENLSFVEPEEPRLLREIGVNYIVKGITERNGFNYYLEPLIMKQLLPEQIRVLVSHAHKIACLITKYQFIPRFRNEVKQIAKQEIEPGMFRNEDTF
jgi:hypothetical protein